MASFSFAETSFKKELADVKIFWKPVISQLCVPKKYLHNTKQSKCSNN